MNFCLFWYQQSSLLSIVENKVSFVYLRSYFKLDSFLQDNFNSVLEGISDRL